MKEFIGWAITMAFVIWAFTRLEKETKEYIKKLMREVKDEK